MSNIVKVCKIHGELTIDQVRRDGHLFRCKECRSIKDKESYYRHREKRVAESQAWKEKNREHYRIWAREDRAKYPEKYREQARRNRMKPGSKKVINEILRMHGVTREEYEQLVKNQNNLCGICGKEETCAGRTPETLKRLAIDHCHYCESLDNEKHVVRGLLCHSCNTGIGKFNDDIALMKKAINYLESHKHIETTKDGTTLEKKDE
jgi:hypothetical protein